MANEFGRNIQDAQFSATFSLSATTGTAATSASYDLGSTGVMPENIELELIAPAIIATAVTQGADVVLKIQQSTSTTFSDDTACFYQRSVATTTGYAGATVRARPGPNGRYVRGSVNVNAVGTTGGVSAATHTATFGLRF